MILFRTRRLSLSVGGHSLDPERWLGREVSQIAMRWRLRVEVRLGRRMAAMVQGLERFPNLASDSCTCFSLAISHCTAARSRRLKIECDALTPPIGETLAAMVAERFQFKWVYGIPRGGTKFARALARYSTRSNEHPVLIADDVLTTGGSMELARSGLTRRCVGVVVFARRARTGFIRYSGCGK